MKQDTGIGIAKHEYGNIFEPLDRMAVSNPIFEGTGIGLKDNGHAVEAYSRIAARSK
jgi:K+-sensing histidine kinase KdpD